MNEKYESEFRPRQLLEEAKALAKTQPFLSKISEFKSLGALACLENK